MGTKGAWLIGLSRQSMGVASTCSKVLQVHQQHNSAGYSRTSFMNGAEDRQGQVSPQADVHTAHLSCEVCTYALQQDWLLQAGQAK